jgi:ribosomal protein S13
MNSIIDLSPKALRRAADLQERISALRDELSDILGSPIMTSPIEMPVRKKMSLSVRRKIAAGARARWAKQRGEGLDGQRITKRARRRRMSAAAKAKISLAAKERWKKVRAAGKNTL